MRESTKADSTYHFDAPDGVAEPTPAVSFSLTVAERAQCVRRLKLANIAPAGVPRDTLIEMAREWGRLADEQDGIVNLYEDE